VRKIPEIWKEFYLEVKTTFYKKLSAKCTNFEVSIFRLEFKVSSLRLGIFDEVSLSKVTVSITSLRAKSKSSKIFRVKTKSVDHNLVESQKCRVIGL